MCGIFGCISSDNCIGTVLDGLKQLQYRGYDSCGVAYGYNGIIKCIKAVGTIEKLKITDKSEIVIGHTRWATHGKVSQENAHPHLSNDQRYALIHNGIIENYLIYYKQLTDKGYCFASQTDSEVIVNMIQNSKKSSTINKLKEVCQKLKGSYAILLYDLKENALFAAKNKSPLNIAVKENQMLISSDIPTLNAEKVFCMEDGEYAKIEKNKLIFYDNKCKILKTSIAINKDNYNLIKNQKHYMLKEILEIPDCYQRTFEHLKQNLANFNFNNYNQIYLIGCGTAYHSCLIGAHYLNMRGFINVHTIIASEFRYANLNIDKNCLAIFVSQSGETADTIACCELTRMHNCFNIVITNVENSTIAKYADLLITIKAGTEIAVASTKAYNCQLLAFEQLILDDLCDCKGLMEQVNKLFKNLTDLKNIATYCNKFSHIICIGRGLDFYVAQEAALKIKEITYLPTTAIASGELKHGTISLIDQNTLVIAIVTQKNIKEKTINALHEIKARNGKIVLVSNFSDLDNCLFDYEINIKNTLSDCLQPLLSIIPLQLIAYYMAVDKGYNPDMPRNLAKSVTVE